jgi:hypothetical protein
MSETTTIYVLAVRTDGTDPVTYASSYLAQLVDVAGHLAHDDEEHELDWYAIDGQTRDLTAVEHAALEALAVQRT